MTDLNGRFTLISVDPITKKVVISLSTDQIYDGGGKWKRQAPHNTGGMNKRLYRTLTTSSGSEYRYVATLSAVTKGYSDTVLDTVVALGEILPSTNWEMPPANMKGIVMLANGIAAGFTGNEVLFSEPFKPYAWPTSYRQTYDQEIVAIAAMGTTLVGMT
jgi:hypothetical protein